MEPQHSSTVRAARRRVAALEARPGLDRVQQVLCEPTRLRIIGALAGQELTVGELAAAIGRKVPATSQHLRILRDLDLVERERRGTAVYYRLRPGPGLEQVRGVLNIFPERAAS